MQALQNCDRSDGGQEEGISPSITRNTHFPGSAAGTNSLRWHHACLTVTAQMRLLWGSAGSSYLGFTERTSGGKRDCRDCQQPTHLARHSSAALPGFLPARGLSPALLSAGDWTACLCHPCPSQPPYSCPCFFLPIKSLVPAAPQECSITSRASACLGQLQAVPLPLQRSSLLQSWLSPPAAPTSHQPGGCSELCGAHRRQLSCATSANHRCSTLAPREGKTKSMHSPGKPFLLHCRI